MSRSHQSTRQFILDYAPPVLEIAKAALDAAPVPGLAFIADVLSVVVERVKDAQINSEAQAALFNRISDLDGEIMEMVNEVRRSPGEAQASALYTRLDKLSRTLAQLQTSSGELKGGQGFRGSIKSFMYAKRNESILQEMDGQLSRALAIFSLRGQVSTEIAVLNVGHAVSNVNQAVSGVGRAVTQVGYTVDTVHEVVINAEEQRVIDAIPHVSAGYHCVDELKSEFLSGTRRELFGELERWARPGSGLNHLYLLTGGAGLGKSSIAHQLCTRLAEQWGLNLGASFFFTRSRGELESCRSFFPTLAHQLMVSQPTLRPNLLRAARAYLTHGVEQQMRSSFEHLLWEPLVTASNSTVGQPITFIIVDGLDECRERNLVPELLRCLLRLIRHLPWLRIFIASRPEPHILPFLATSVTADVVYHRSLNDTISEWKGDVELYLQQTVPKIHGYGDYVHHHPHMLGRLIRRANGLFIYARTAVNFLETYDDHPEEQFEILLARKGAGLAPIDELYLNILQVSFPRKDMLASPRRLWRLRQLLAFLTFRKDQVGRSDSTIESFGVRLPSTALLLRVAPDDLVGMVDRLRSILLIDSRDDIVPLHASFIEFLVDNTRCIDALYHIDEARAHVRLACGCLTAFSFDMIDHLLTVEQSDDRSSVLGRYLCYAGWLLEHHIKAARRNEEVKELILDVIRNHLPIFMLVAGNDTGMLVCLTEYLTAFEGTELAVQESHKFHVYCMTWWERYYRSLRSRERMVSVTLKDVQVGDGGAVISHQDATRYRTALEDTARKIEKSRVSHLWFELIYEPGAFNFFHSPRD